MITALLSYLCQADECRSQLRIIRQSLFQKFACCFGFSLLEINSAQRIQIRGPARAQLFRALIFIDSGPLFRKFLGPLKENPRVKQFRRHRSVIYSAKTDVSLGGFDNFFSSQVNSVLLIGKALEQRVQDFDARLAAVETLWKISDYFFQSFDLLLWVLDPPCII